MRKLMMVLAAVVAGCAFADRTANREWVGRNFAPSNLVPRVESVEDTLTNGTRIALGRGAAAMANGTVQIGAGTNATAGTLQFRTWQLVGADGRIPKERFTESDPAFELWRTNATEIAVGCETVASASASTAVGTFSTASGACSVALGAESEATAAYAVQLGAGRNSTYGSLQFGEWTLLDEFGKIPTARLPAVQPGSCIPKAADERVVVGPLVINAEPVLLALGVCRIGSPWDRSTRSLDSGCAYTEGSWTFSDGWDNVVNIGPDGIYVYGDNYLTFVNGGQNVSFADKVKSIVTPAVVLEKIKAMNDTQKAELKAFLGIQ